MAKLKPVTGKELSAFTSRVQATIQSQEATIKRVRKLSIDYQERYAKERDERIREYNQYERAEIKAFFFGAFLGCAITAAILVWPWPWCVL